MTEPTLADVQPMTADEAARITRRIVVKLDLMADPCGARRRVRGDEDDDRGDYQAEDLEVASVTDQKYAGVSDESMQAAVLALVWDEAA